MESPQKPKQTKNATDGGCWTPWWLQLQLKATRHQMLKPVSFLARAVLLCAYYVLRARSVLAAASCNDMCHSTYIRAGLCVSLYVSKINFHYTEIEIRDDSQRLRNTSKQTRCYNNYERVFFWTRQKQCANYRHINCLWQSDKGTDRCITRKRWLSVNVSGRKWIASSLKIINSLTFK